MFFLKRGDVISAISDTCSHAGGTHPGSMSEALTPVAPRLGARAPFAE